MSSPNNSQANGRASLKTMRATIWKGKPYHVSIENVPKPRLLSSEDAIVRLTSAAICGSDLHVYRGILGSANPPWGLGHEGVGVVDSVGEAVQNVKPGDRVIVPCIPDEGVLNIDQLIGPLETFGVGADFGSNDGLQGTQKQTILFTNTVLTASSRVLQVCASRYNSHPDPTLSIKRARLPHDQRYLGYRLDMP